MDEALAGKAAAVEAQAVMPYPMPYENGEWPKEYTYEGTFPEDFVWGVGTASYQIEGAYREDGRGASIWDTFSGANTVGMPGGDCSYCCKEAPCTPNGAMFAKGDTGNVAVDHYHLYKSDIQLMKSMGLKNYRFSISWPRLIPTGKLADGVNPKAVEFYNNLINSLLEAGITPYVTIYHWDLPQALLDPPKTGGWWSRDETGQPDLQILPDFLDFADTCFKEFGDRIKHWVTFNEAWTFTYLASGYGKAPSIPEYSDMQIDPYIAGHTVLLAHGYTVKLYREKYQEHQRGKIGITNNCDWREPLTTSQEDIIAAERSVLHQLGWFSDPIFGKYGDYPPEMRALFGTRLPQFTEAEREILKGSADFFGLNHYGTAFVSYDPLNEGVDVSYSKQSHGDLPQGASVWLFGSGWGFRKMLNWVGRRYDNPPLLVTEGGWSTFDKTPEHGANDPMRALYYANYTSELLKGINEDGLNIQGYFAWSLVDNYEWERGYSERFGLTYSDFDLGHDPNAPGDRKVPTEGKQWRRRKDSSCFLQHVWSTQSLVNPAQAKCPSAAVFDGKFIEETTGCKRSLAVSDGKLKKLEGQVPKAGTQLKIFGGLKETCDGNSTQYQSYADVDFQVSGTSIIATVGDQLLNGFWSEEKQAILWGDGALWTKVDDSMQV